MRDGGIETITKWTTILPKVPLGPHSRHLFKIAPSDEAYNYVKLSMYPDGGIVSDPQSRVSSLSPGRLGSESMG